MFSRSATGFIEGPAAAVGTSGFAAAMALGTAVFVVELGATLEGSLLAEVAVIGLAILLVPGAGFEADAGLEVGFAGVFVTGLAVAFDEAVAADELGVEPDAGVGVGAGLAAELVGGTGFGA